MRLTTGRGLELSPTSQPGRVAWTAWLAVETARQARFAFLPPAAVRTAQSRRVRAAVAHAYEHVPYYSETMRRRGLLPAEVLNVEDLARLPLIEREQLQRDPEYFVSTAAPISSYLQARTSGSSGRPVTVFRDLEGLFRRAAYRERQRVVIRRLAGRRFRYRGMFVDRDGNSGRDAGNAFRRHALLSSVRVDERHGSLLDPIADTMARLAERPTDVLDAYGSYLAALCHAIEHDGMPPPAVRVVTHGGDHLPSAARRFLSDTLGIPVVSLYGAREAPQIGFQCEQGGHLHLNADLYPIRIVDAEGAALPSGERGDVVISNLTDRGTVLLNYRLGDIAAIQPASCSCGRSLPLLSLPAGRSHDWLVLPGGRRVHPFAVLEEIEPEPGVWQMQITQDSPTLVRVALVSSKDDRGDLCDRISARLTRLLGDATAVDVRIVDALPRDASGKIRAVVSHVDADAQS